MDKIEFTRAQRAILDQLIDDWREWGRRELAIAEKPGTPPARVDEARRVSGALFRCCDDLRNAADMGELPARFGFQIRKMPHRGLVG